MRKVLILLILTAGVAGATYYFVSNRDQPTSTPATNLANNTVALPQSTTPSQEILSLRDDVIGFLKIDLAQTAELVERFNQFAASISGAPLWKRIGIGDRIAAAFLEGTRAHAEEPDKAPDQARAAIQTALDIAREVKTLFVVLAPASGKLPVQLMLDLGVTGSKLQKFIEQNLVANKVMQLEKQANGFNIKLLNPNDQDVPAKIEFANNSVRVFFNSNSAADFSGAKTLKDSPILDLITQSTLPGNFFQMYADMHAVMKLMVQAIQISQQEPGAQSEFSAEQLKSMMEQQWGGIKTVSLTAAFHSGLESRQCVDLDADSWMSKIYSVFEAHNTNKRTTNQFAGLVGPDTLGAFWLDGRGTEQIVLAYIDAMSKMFETVAQAAKTKDEFSPEAQGSINSIVKSVKDFVMAYHPDEIGIIVRPSVGLPWPDLLVFYSDQKLSSFEILKQIKDVTEKLPRTTADAPSLELSGEGTNAQLKLVGAPVPVPFLIAALGEHGIVFSSGPGAVQVARSKLGQTDAFAKGLGVTVGGTRIAALDSDYYMLLNSKRMFDLVRPYMPMMIAQAARSGQQVSIEEASDMLNRLERQFLSVQSIRMVSPGRYCAESAVEVTTAQ